MGALRALCFIRMQLNLFVRRSPNVSGEDLQQPRRNTLVRHGRCMVLCVLVAPFLACGQTRAAPLRAPYAASNGVTETDHREVASVVHDSVFALFGVPSLRLATLPDRTDEVRLSAGGSMFLEPTALLRLIRTHDTTAGEIYLYWPTGDSTYRQSEALFMSSERLRRNRCRTLVRSVQLSACRLRLAKSPNWSRVGRALDSLGVWSLPHPDAMPRPTRTGFATDQPSLLLETRTGGMYRTGFYDALRQYTGRPGVSVRALYELIVGDSLW